MKCPYCGSSHPEGTKFCPVTGQQFLEIEDEFLAKSSAAEEEIPSVKFPKQSMIILAALFVIFIVVGVVLLRNGQIGKLFNKDGASTQVLVFADDKLSELNLGNEPIINIHFRPAENLIILVYQNELLVFLHDQEGFRLQKSIEESNPVKNSYSSTGGQFIGLDCSEEFVLIDLDTDEKSQFEINQIVGEISSVSISNEGQFVAFLLLNGQAEIWDVENTVWISLAIKDSAIKSLAFRYSYPDQIYILEKNLLHAWSLAEAQEMQNFTLQTGDAKRVIGFQENEKFFVVFDNFIECWSTQSENTLYQLSLDTTNLSDEQIFIYFDTVYILQPQGGWVVNLDSGEMMQEFSVPAYSLVKISVFPTSNRIYLTSESNQVLYGELSVGENDIQESVTFHNIEPELLDNQIFTTSTSNEALDEIKIPDENSQQTPVVVDETTEEPTVMPTSTSVPVTVTPTNEPTISVIDSRTNPKDNMMLVYVPDGEFIMGSNEDEDPYFWGAEGPTHPVNVDAFWIYQTEVTNAMYQACVAEQACPRPLRNESQSVEDYYTNPNYADYPVIQVNWVDAVSYCVWVGGRLPTEAEWEKAARGTDGRLFPWGNSSLQTNYASFCGSRCPNYEKENIDDGYYETAPVGSFPAGASPYGALDMAGNVWEWVNDYFDSNYYKNSPYENPLGPASGSRRVIRGGSWYNPASGVRTVARTSLPPQDGLETVGFRCVIDVAP